MTCFTTNFGSYVYYVYLKQTMCVDDLEPVNVFSVKGSDSQVLLLPRNMVCVSIPTLEINLEIFIACGFGLFHCNIAVVLLTGP